jgi:chromate transporter
MSDAMADPGQGRKPADSLGGLFLRFLRFGVLGWGGPAAQLAMIRHELVDQEQWLTNDRFNRVLAVYQILPGPEAHEMCVYFGMQARGRWGGFWAGMAFMLPGFLLMLLLSWVYVTYGLTSPWLMAAFAGMQAAVCAVVLRAVHRIGSHTVHNRWLWGIAIASTLAHLLHVHFVLILALAGMFYLLIRRRRQVMAALVGVVAGAGLFYWTWYSLVTAGALAIGGGETVTLQTPSQWELLLAGLRGGLFTFGGAYSVISYLQADAVTNGQWMSNSQFLDGLALSGILPAPTVIFGTFVGYVAGGLPGALAVTIGIFVPAFAFSLIGHEYIERLINHRPLHDFLDGVAAGVVGMIAGTALQLMLAAITSWGTGLICGVALVVLFRWHAKAAVPVAVLAAALVGVLAYWLNG